MIRARLARTGVRRGSIPATARRSFFAPWRAFGNFTAIARRRRKLCEEGQCVADGELDGDLSGEVEENGEGADDAPDGDGEEGLEVNEDCQPTTCYLLGKACGEWPDECGGMLDCGGCDDRNDCTYDRCSERGSCEHDPSGSDGRECDDGEEFTMNEVCENGYCVGEWKYEDERCETGEHGACSESLNEYLQCMEDGTTFRCGGNFPFICGLNKSPQSMNNEPCETDDGEEGICYNGLCWP